MAYVPLSFSKVAVRYGATPQEAEADMVSGNFFSDSECSRWRAAASRWKTNRITR